LQFISPQQGALYTSRNAALHSSKKKRTVKTGQSIILNNFVIWPNKFVIALTYRKIWVFIFSPADTKIIKYVLIRLRSDEVGMQNLQIHGLMRGKVPDLQ
jgi:hypothetical protein